jgi:multicomponent Na+:H+ antiporter subunit D
MFLGVLGAISQKTIKKILSYHILSQVGYMVLGLGIFTSGALAAGLLFVIHNIVVKSSLFWIGGEAARKGDGEELGKMRALWACAPFLGICFLLQALSLAGVPPLSGFWGKFLLLSSAFTGKHYFLLLFALVTSFWTLFSMVKIWLGAFWGQEQAIKSEVYDTWRVLPIALSVIISLALGFGVETAYRVSLHAANELFDPAIYVQAVIGGKA